MGTTNFHRYYLCITLTTLFILLFAILSVQYSFIPNFDKYQPVREPRICCLIFTAPKYFNSRTLAVNSTWAPRCDRYYFISEPSNDSVTPMQYRVSFQFPLAPIGNITQGYGHLTQKATAAFRFVYERHRDDFDWFVKADDDTYLIVENLRAFLREQNSSEPVTFGYNFKMIVRGGYHSGGAAYVLSREALSRLYRGLSNETSADCPKDGGSEDVEIAKCLRSEGAYIGKSLDKYGRELFHPLSFQSFFREKVPEWLDAYAENPVQKSYNCCSDRSISFHYVSPEDQHFMDFLLYRARSPDSLRGNFFKKFFLNTTSLNVTEKKSK